MPFAFAGVLLSAAGACDGDVTRFIGKAQTRPSVTTAPPPPDAPPSGLDAAAGVLDAALPRNNPDAAGGSPGCGRTVSTGLTSIQLTSSGDTRRYHVVVPTDYDPQRNYPLVFVFHARAGSGLQVREALALETVAANWALYVYPDGKVEERSSGQVVSGWQNGPFATEYAGVDDLEFVADMLLQLGERYCIDRDALFAVGPGWGGEFSSVLACYSETPFKGFAQAGSNTPYFLPVDPATEPRCTSSGAAFIFHGKGDSEFPLEEGQRHLEFWRQRNNCSAESTPIEFDGFAADDECAALSCERHPTQYCWYTAQADHDVPNAYFSSAVTDFFRAQL